MAVPAAVNEPVRSYAPGTPERADLEARLDSMAQERIEIPVVIGGERIKTGLRWLLTAFMVGAGANHFIAPATYVAMMPSALPAPLALVYISGVAEICGGLGLILPSLLRIRPGLTPLAAAGLVIIMTGATIVSLMIGPVALAAMPFVVGLLAAFVAYGRWKLAPIRGSSQPSTLQEAR